MAYCPKCGTKVDEKMAFCPRCGVALRARQPSGEAAPVPAHYRSEKAEKHEKWEKTEKGEKHEKQEFGVIGPLVGGLFLVFIGLMSFLSVIGFVERGFIAALFLIMIGVIVIFGGIYAARRHPRP